MYISIASDIIDLLMDVSIVDIDELKLIKKVKEYSGAIAITLVWGKRINSSFLWEVDEFIDVEEEDGVIILTVLSIETLFSFFWCCCCWFMEFEWKTVHENWGSEVISKISIKLFFSF